MDGIQVKEKHGGKFYYRMYLTTAMGQAPIEELDLSVRSYNSLKRAGYHTIGDVANAVAEGQELRRIRNCGAKSALEIMARLFLYQYYALQPDRRENYLLETIALNYSRNQEKIFEKNL